ncbi:PIN domain-containing protein [Streptomyces wedmorensis]
MVGTFQDQRRGALILDSEGLTKAVQRDREVHEWLTAARDADLPVITSAAVLVEVIHPRINDAALKWTLSRLRVEPVTQALAPSAAGLLRAAGLHGHKYAIDAMLCATAIAQPGRVTILTSGVEDIAVLTGDHPCVTAEEV